MLNCHYRIIGILICVFLNANLLFSQEVPQKSGISITRSDNVSYGQVSVTIAGNNYVLSPNRKVTLELTSGQYLMVATQRDSGGSISTSTDVIINNDFHIYTVSYVPGSGIYISKTSTLLVGRDNNAIKNSFNVLSQNIRNGSKIAIINIEAGDVDEGEFFIEEITMEFVNSRNYVIVDRRTLDVVLREQNFQMTGYVDDDSIVSIGHFLGADVVISGGISGTGNRKRLRFRALDVRTAQILAMSSESM
jgi:hypothetical protein